MTEQPETWQNYVRRPGPSLALGWLVTGLWPFAPGRPVIGFSPLGLVAFLGCPLSPDNTNADHIVCRNGLLWGSGIPIPAMYLADHRWFQARTGQKARP